MVDFKRPKSKNTPLPIDPNLFTDEVPSNDVALPSTGFVVDLTVPMVQELLPEGDYNATIVHAEPAIARASGNPMIKLRWRIDGGAYDQRSIFDFLVFKVPTGDWNSDFPARRIKLLVETLGNHIAPSGAINPELLLGESCVIHVVVKKQSGVNAETGEPYPEQNSIGGNTSYKPAGSIRKVDDLL